MERHPLTLPEPATLAQRVAAAAVDVGVAALAGGTAALVADAGAQLVFGAPLSQWVSFWTGASVATVAFALRDALWEDGTRSLGKRLLGLEVTYWDGSVCTRRHALVRNAYWIPFGLLWDVHPLAQQAALLVLAFDSISVLVTEDLRRGGDYVAGTRVVQEASVPSPRAVRLLDLEEAEAMVAAEQEIEQLNRPLGRLLQHRRVAYNPEGFFDHVLQSRAAAAATKAAASSGDAPARLAIRVLPGERRTRASENRADDEHRGAEEGGKEKEEAGGEASGGAPGEPGAVQEREDKGREGEEAEKVRG